MAKIRNKDKNEIIKKQITKLSGYHKADDFSMLEHCPKKFYRYCRFDEKHHYLDALEEQFLYLNPLNNMDDQFEGTLSIDISGKENYIKNKYFKKIIKKEFKNKGKEYEKLIKILDDCETYNETVNKIIEIAKKEGKEEEITKIQKEIDNIDFKKLLEKFFSHIFNNNEKFGASSLCEVNNSQIMWQMYGDNYKGFIVEYSVDKNDTAFLKRLFPVVYKENRSFNPIELFLKILLTPNEDDNHKQLKREFIIKSLVTKNKEWEIQKEWRVIDKAGDTIESPKITGVYLCTKGKENDKEYQKNLSEVLQIQEKLGFKIYDCYFDYEETKLKYNTF